MQCPKRAPPCRCGRRFASVPPSSYLGNRILRPETDGHIVPLEARKPVKSRAETGLRPGNPLKLRRVLQTRKPLRLLRTGWWRTQSRQTGLHWANSLLTGKRTGNFSFFGHFGENRLQNRARFQSVTNKFPKNRNREIIRQSRRGRYANEQGIITANTSSRRRGGFAAFIIVRVYLMYPRHRDAGG